MLGQMNGVDVVLQAVAIYKSKDPKNSEESEMVENLFDFLCCLLIPLENKERFVEVEGVELMIIILKQKKLAYGHRQMRGRIELLLKQNRLGKNDIKDMLQGYCNNIGDLDGPDEKEPAQAKIQEFISAL